MMIFKNKEMKPLLKMKIEIKSLCLQKETLSKIVSIINKIKRFHSAKWKVKI